MPEEQKNEKSVKPKGLKKWLIGGTLTAVAAGAFLIGPHVMNRLQQPVNNFPTVTLTEPTSADVTIAQQDNLYPAVTKDQQMVRVYMDVRPLDSGVLDSAEFETSLKEYAMVHLMAIFQQYDLKDIPANLQKIQQDVTAAIASTLPVGVPAEGTGILPMAQPGVNFEAPTITQIKDAAGENTLFAPSTVRSAAAKFGL